MKNQTKFIGVLVSSVVILMMMFSTAACSGPDSSSNIGSSTSMTSGSSQSSGETEAVLESISLNTDKTLTEFTLNDEFDYTGLIVTANYSDNTTEDVTQQSTVSSPDMTTSGEKSVTVTYSGKSATYSIDVYEQSYTFQAENQNVVTTSGSLGGVATFTDREDYSTGELVSGRGNFSSNAGASIAFNLSVAETTTMALLVRVSRGTGGVTTFTDVALPIIVNSEGDTDILSSPVTVEKTTSGAWFDFEEISLGNITLTAGINTIKFAPTGTAYNFDYIALLSDTEVDWSDGTPADIIATPRHGGQDTSAEQLTLSNPVFGDGVFTASVSSDIDLVGGIDTITWNNEEVDHTIVFNSDTSSYDLSLDINSITLVSNSTYIIRFIQGNTELALAKVTYIAGSNINTNDYDDSDWTVSSPFYAYSAPSSNTLNDGVVISSKLKATTNRPDGAGYYPIGNLDMNKGESVTFYINASQEGVVGLYMELGNLSNQNIFSDWLDLNVNGTDYTSDAAMPNGTNYTPSDAYSHIGYVNLQEGNNKITFTVNSTSQMNGHNIYGLQFTSENAEITWGEAPVLTLDSISLDSSSTEKTEYLAGETFDTTGLILDATWSDGSTTKITEGFTAEPSGALTVDDTSVAISYTYGDNTYTVNIDITVDPVTKTLTSVAISEDSTYQTEFTAGDTFDASCITLIASWSDDSTSEIAPGDFTVNPSGVLTSDITSVTLSYTYAGVTESVDIPVTVEGEEAELRAFTAPGSSTFSDGVSTTPGTAPTNITTTRDNAEGYHCIGGLNANVGASVTFIITANKVGSVKLYTEFCLRCDKQYYFNDCFSLTINGVEVDSTATMPYISGGTTFAASNEYTYLCLVDLAEGTNTITFTTIANNAFNIYGIKCIIGV